jgi:DNA-binding SARP family transcriptional activator
MELCLSLLGPFQTLLDGRPATFATDHARALLAYLSAEAGRAHRRDVLAGLLWPDSPESLARRNLSQTLVRLRRAIGDYYADPPYLAIAGKTLQFYTATVQVDLARFEELLAACAAHRHTSPVDCLPCVQRLEAVTQLYRGDFLQDLFLAGSQLFQEWALVKREQLHRQALAALHTLTVYYADRAAYDQAERYAARQLALEPWREAAHRQRMHALALGGQRDAALAQ